MKEKKDRHIFWGGFCIFVCVALLLVTSFWTFFARANGYNFSNTIEVMGNGMGDAVEDDAVAFYDSKLSNQLPSSDGVSVDSAVRSPKIIYSADMSFNTVSFDDAYSFVVDIVTEQGGYLEENNVRTVTSGIGGIEYRKAFIKIRIPVDHFEGFLDSVSGNDVLNLVSKNVNATDVSEDYYDVDLRLNNAKDRLSKLKSILESATTVQDVMTVESEISSAEYTIESLQGRLNDYDSKISYSTVNVYLDEVSAVESKASTTTYKNQVVNGLYNGWIDGVEFFRNLSLWFFSNWLILSVVILIIVLIIIIVLVKRHKKKEAAVSEREIVISRHAPATEYTGRRVPVDVGRKIERQIDKHDESSGGDDFSVSKRHSENADSSDKVIK